MVNIVVSAYLIQGMEFIVEIRVFVGWVLVLFSGKVNMNVLVVREYFQLHMGFEPQ
jgi:hypothetical protein